MIPLECENLLNVKQTLVPAVSLLRGFGVYLFICLLHILCIGFRNSLYTFISVVFPFFWHKSENYSLEFREYVYILVFISFLLRKVNPNCDPLFDRTDITTNKMLFCGDLGANYHKNYIWILNSKWIELKFYVKIKVLFIIKSFFTEI